jgi:peptide/nickel transport system ATP-binding protein
VDVDASNANTPLAFKQNSDPTSLFLEPSRLNEAFYGLGQTSGLPSLNAPLMQVSGLCKTFQIRQGLLGWRSFEALKNVTFTLNRGETLGVVGESGCGKTTLGLSLMRLHLPSGGKVMFDGIDLAELSETQWQGMRRRIQIVFQNPYASLNPRFTVAQILMEPMHIHGIGENERERLDKAISLIAQVGLPVDALNRYPHEFSGGQRQRIAIARCLSLEPELLILDESVSALDVSVQAQVLNLLKDLQKKLGMAYLFISHDLAVVRYLSDRVLVMHGGEVVEEGGADALFDGSPHHPYTERLLSSIPGRVHRFSTDS